MDENLEQADTSLATLPDSIWCQIILLLPNQEFMRMPQLSLRFYLICKSAAVKAMYFVKMYSREVLFYNLYRFHRSSLTIELTERLLELEIPIPKFLIEMTFGIRNLVQFPEGMMELFLDYGNKQYPGGLYIGERAVDCIKNDANSFIACMADPSTNLDRLRTIVLKNYYSPAFNPLQNENEWKRIWTGLAALAMLDPLLSYHITKHSGHPLWRGNDQVMGCILVIPNLTIHQFRPMLAAGFYLDDHILVSFMTAMDPNSSFPNSDIFSALYPPEKLALCSQDALYQLFQENSVSAIRICEHLIKIFALTEHDIGIALCVKPEDIPQDSSRFMCTTFGAFNGGMNDQIWRILIDLFGPTHRFMEWCMIDLLVGENVTSKMVTDELLDTDTDDEDETNNYEQPNVEDQTRLTLRNMIDLGIPLKFHSFVIISNVILDTRGVLPRFIDYMCHLEQHLLSLNTDEVLPWIDLFEQNVLENPSWTTIFPQVSIKKSGFQGFVRSISDTVRKLDLQEFKWRELRKFYQVVVNLTTVLTSQTVEGTFNDSPTTDSLIGGQKSNSTHMLFGDWFEKKDPQLPFPSKSIEPNHAKNWNPSFWIV